MKPLRQRIRGKTLLLVLLLGWVVALLLGTLLPHVTDSPALRAGDGLLEQSAEAGAANAVTTVVVSFRGFDTLGEITVLFLAATGIGFLFAGTPRQTAAGKAPNEMMVTGIRLLFPLILLFGVYIVLHGHLTPGGGFQGGVIIATAFFLRMLAEPSFQLPHPWLARLEAFSGGGFVVFGFLGLFVVATGTFLGNFLPHPTGAMGQLISAGVIPLISILIGIKVGTEVGGLFQSMLAYTDDSEEAS